MYLEHFHLKEFPFREDTDPEIFFEGAGRREILYDLLADIEAGTALIRLIGEEGSGKTLLCALLEQRLADRYEIVYLSEPVGSFVELIKNIVGELGGTVAENVTRAEIVAELQKLLEHKKEKGEGPVLLLLDEAEKLFQATLESLVRLSRENKMAEGLRILLAARPELDTAVNQIVQYCADVKVDEGRTLGPLTADETADYLDYRLRMAGREGKGGSGSLFTPQAVTAIFEKARGNMRFTGRLAHEALRNACLADKEIVGPEHVVSDAQPGKTKKRRSVATGLAAAFDLEQLKQNKWLVGGLVTVLSALILLAYLLPGNDEQQSAEPIVPPAPATDTQADASQSNATVQRKVEEEKDEPSTQSGLTDSTLATSVVKNNNQEVQPGKGEDSSIDVEALYDERLRASASWLAGAYRGGYTIQLMMLASDKAEQSARELFRDPEMRAVKDNIFILRKKTSPPTVFFFYGSYESLDKARNARNHLPLFLRKHHPYAISISNALRKMED